MTTYYKTRKTVSREYTPTCKRAHTCVCMHAHAHTHTHTHTHKTELNSKKNILPTNLFGGNKDIDEVAFPLGQSFLGVLGEELLHFVLDNVPVLGHIGEVGDVIVFLRQSC